MGAAAIGTGVIGLFSAGLAESEHGLNKKMARRTEEDAKHQAEVRRIEAERLMKSQISQYGASGVELEGSPMEVIQQDQVDAEIEAMNMIYAGKLKKAEMIHRSRLQKNAAFLSMGKDAGLMAGRG
jgi:hypothetical protein